MRECDAVGAVEGFQIDSPIADARLHGYDSSQEFAVLTRIERGRWQFVPTFLFAQVANLPNKVIVGFSREPRLQHVADAEPLALTSEEAPRAL